MINREQIKRKIQKWKLLQNRRRVLIIEDLRVGYIPIYKVASTSLRNLICGRQKGHHFPEWRNRKLTVSKKRQVERCIRKSAGIRKTRRLKRKYFLFAFVRNPVTRLYSCYLDKVVRPGKEGKRCNLRRYGIETDMDFDAFARRIAEIPDSEADKHFRSQLFEIYHQGEWLVDFVGKLENMVADWQRLAEKTGLQEIPEIYRRTGAGNGLDQLPLSPETARLIARRYSRAIDLLGYRQEIDAWLDRKSYEQADTFQQRKAV
ncbi:MAG TPA: sulfotransferase family 2 domain-containing protein [Desulfosalsimonadaceae bacterium]|nr:sulfotransferase family 2 domain-containing protein [Desulfosalsimonadaceae bacterium]